MKLKTLILLTALCCASNALQAEEPEQCKTLVNELVVIGDLYNSANSKSQASQFFSMSTVPGIRNSASQQSYYDRQQAIDLKRQFDAKLQEIVRWCPDTAKELGLIPQ